MTDTDHDHHGHGHGHGHHAGPAARAEALESLLVERGLVTSGLVDKLGAAIEERTGPLLGARVVARAWVDPAYEERLLADPGPAIAEVIGPRAEPLIVVRNRPGVHNVVCCTLCSCYPTSVLGPPPAFYKSFSYRSRVVREPRTVLRELGLDLDEGTDIHVWDSSSDARYLVLPERPARTEQMSEDDLVPLITRNALIGVARVAAPTGVDAGEV